MKYHMITDVWVKVVHMLSQTPLRFFLYPHPGMIRITYRNFSVFEVCFLGSHKLVLLPNVVFSLPLWLLLLPEPGSLKAKH